MFAAADEVGIPQQTFKLLGVTYNSMRAVPIFTGAVGKELKARCKRIQLCGQSRSLRCDRLRRLLVPLFRWAAPWLRHYKNQKDIQSCNSAIEHAAWGSGIPRGRSSALSWLGVVGLDLLPDYVCVCVCVCVEAVILREHRRLHLQRGAGDIFTTMHDSFRDGTVNAAGLRRQLRLAWARKLLLPEPKTKEEGRFTGD